MLAAMQAAAQSAAMPIPGTTATGATAPAVPVTVTLARTGSIGTVLLRAQGSSGFDFTNAGGGTCVVGQSFTAGQQCTVSVSFTPVAPGERRGAIVLLDSSNNVLGTRLLDAFATGALGTFIPGTMSTVAGDQTWIYGGDGAPATQSSIFLPFGVAVDAAGDLFIADSSNNRIRRVDAGTGLISTVAGNGNIGGTGDGALAIAASLSNPSSIVLDAAGNLYFADSGNNVVRRVDAFTGIITTVAGTMGAHGYTGNGSAATAATLTTPNGISLDASNNLFIADTGNNVVRRVDGVTGIITTVAGTGAAAYTGDGTLATAATLNAPWGVTVSAGGELYIADQNNHAIRKVNAVGMISTVAGTGVAGFSGDLGPASAAQLNVPASVALDVAGNLYIADSGNNRVRKINASTSVITTIAGNADESFSGDNGPADAASLYGPYTLALDAQGNLLIADVFHNRIRRVASNAATLQFPPMRVGRVAPPMTQTLENDGNAPMTVANIQAVTNANVDAPTTTCTTGDVLAVLGQCVIGASFAPTVTGQLVAGTVDANSNAANSPGVITLLGQVLDIDPSTVTLISATNPSFTGQPVVFSVNVTSAGTTPTGTVTLLDGTTTVASGQLTNGSASLSVPTLTQGQHSITASYSGDSSNAAGISTALIQNVKDAVAATTTTLNISTNQVVAGASLLLTANVAVSIAGNGTGPIGGSATFKDGTIVLGSASVTNGVATLQVTLGTGPHMLVASYTGSANYTASDSAAVSITSQRATTKTALSTSASPSNSGAPLLLTATVLSTGGTATGSVTFSDGAAVLGSAPLNGQDVATLTVPGSAWTVGTHALTASYTGDTNDGGSTSTTINQLVNLAQTSVSLSSSLNPVGLGGSVTFYATATGNGGVPAGALQFFDGSTSLGSVNMNATGNAAFSTSALTLGSHAITAVYAGDPLDGGSTSQPVTENVQQATIAVTLQASTASTLYGTSVTLAANVTGTGSQPTGTVTFNDGGTGLGSVAVNAGGAASLTLSTLSIGAHSIIAVYSGDVNHAAASSGAVAVSVLQSTSTSLTPSSTHLTAGVALQLAMKVVGANGQPVTGAIKLQDGASVLAMLTPDAGGAASMSLSTLLPGQHTFTAVFAGDANDAPSTSTPQVSTIDLATTSTALQVSANPVLSGAPLTLTAAVTGNGGTPTGTIAFKDGATTIATAPLSAGTALLTLTTLTPGLHTISASYAGDPQDSASVSAAVTEQVAQSTTVTLSASANPALLTDTVTITATVANGGAAPTGQVTLADSGTVIATATLNPAGVAVFTLTSPSLGQHALTAAYAGDSQNLPATSSPLIETVILRPTTTSLNTSSTNLAAGQQLVLIGVVQGSGSRLPNRPDQLHQRLDCTGHSSPRCQRCRDPDAQPGAGQLCRRKQVQRRYALQRIQLRRGRHHRRPHARVHPGRPAHPDRSERPTRLAQPEPDHRRQLQGHALLRLRGSAGLRHLHLLDRPDGGGRRAAGLALGHSRYRQSPRRGRHGAAAASTRRNRRLPAARGPALAARTPPQTPGRPVDLPARLDRRGHALRLRQQLHPEGHAGRRLRLPGRRHRQRHRHHPDRQRAADSDRRGGGPVIRIGWFRTCWLLACAVTLACLARAAHGQAEYTATGPGTYISAGVTFAGFQQAYGQRYVGGGTAFVDANLYRRIGVEAEARELNLHTDEGVRETTYLVGPRLSPLRRGSLRPYAKLLAGRGELRFPFGDARGSYFVAAPGAGLDWRVQHSRLLIRVIDFEYQIWPQFTFGTLHPYGASAGLSWTLYNGSSEFRRR